MTGSDPASGPAPADRAHDVVCALRAAVALPHTSLRAVLDEAADHLERVLRERPPDTVAAVAVPLGVGAALGADPPRGLLAASAATYLAVDVLDDRMDGDEPGFWYGRESAEVTLGAVAMLQLAGFHDQSQIGIAWLRDWSSRVWRAPISARTRTRCQHSRRP